MVCWSCAGTVYCVVFSRASSLTLPTTLSGECLSVLTSIHADISLHSCSLACTRNNGNSPCPRCFVHKNQIVEMGGKRDRKRRKKVRKDTPDNRALLAKARKNIFLNGMSTTSQYVECWLKEDSLLPVQVRLGVILSDIYGMLTLIIQSAFSIRLSRFGFNFYSLFAGDFLHENEIGNIKNVVEHTLRVLEAVGSDGTQTLDDRYVGRSPVYT